LLFENVLFYLIFSILSVLGLLDNFKDICDLKNDEMGIILEDEDLPKRVRYKKVSEWKDTANSLGISKNEIKEMESAFIV